MDTSNPLSYPNGPLWPLLFFLSNLVAEPERIHYSSLQVELSELPSSITDSNIHTVTNTRDSEMCVLKNRYTEFFKR